MLTLIIYIVIFVLSTTGAGTITAGTLWIRLGEQKRLLWLHRLNDMAVQYRLAAPGVYDRG